MVDAAGVTLDCADVESTRVAVAQADFLSGNAGDLVRANRLRIEEGKFYKVRFHATATVASSLNAQVRFRSRTSKFVWTQLLEVGGPHAAGAANNTMAVQALPGIGGSNPDRRTPGEPGGWYTLYVRSPLDRAIRTDKGGAATPLSVSMPVLSAEPGPGVEARSRRDILFGFDLIDTIGTGAGAELEKANATLDAIEVQTLPVPAD